MAYLAYSRLITLTNIDDKKVRDLADQAIPDPDMNRDASDVSERLRHAVEMAGGPSRVSAQSGIPLRSLSHYLGGRDMRRAALVALADACGISVEWLATGRGAMSAHSGQSQAQHQESYADWRDRTLQSQSQGQTDIPEHQESVAPPPIDDAILAQTIEVAKLFVEHFTKPIETPEYAKLLANIYKKLSDNKP